MTRYEKRVKRLRERVMKNQKKPTELTVAEIKAKLDELGIDYDKKATKAELLELLKDSEKDQTEAE